MNGVNELLETARTGNWKAAEDILPLVYQDLRRLASQKMAAEAAGHTLQPTALVHEAWLRLAGASPTGWQSEGHFFAAAAEAMRRVLVDHARRRQCQKRGGDLARVELDESVIESHDVTQELLAIDDALEKLSQEDPDAAALVKLRYFAGMTMPEAAAALNMAPRSAERLWSYARARLRREIRAAGQLD